jgi:hypothetical protein
MSTGVIHAITQADDRLKVLREGWEDSKSEKKSTWMEKINRELDERVKLMAIRDGKLTTQNA